MTGVVGGVTDGILFYVAAYSVQLVGAFAVVAAVSGVDGARSSINDYRGLAKRSPLLAGSFAVLLLGMAGLPLTSGFVAKFGVFASAWANDYQWLVIMAVVVSVIAFAFYLKVIVVMYMNDSDEELLPVGPGTQLALGISVTVTILFGILPGPLLEFAANALPL
jgi:NADH-quinone oxidoreductase subunit N